MPRYFCVFIESNAFTYQLPKRGKTLICWSTLRVICNLRAFVLTVPDNTLEYSKAASPKRDASKYRRETQLSLAFKNTLPTLKV